MIEMSDEDARAPEPVMPVVPEYIAHEAIEVMRKWFADRGGEFNPDQFPMEKPE